MLIEPLGNYTLSELMKGMKGGSARQANKILGSTGQFWLDESFDHIVRSEAQYQHFLEYIAENPAKVNLRPDEYWLYLPTREMAIHAGEAGTDRNVCATLEERLRHLLAYNDEPHQFSPAEVEVLIAAIDSLKALDPACGSGAFPMGLLHKLVHILGKLDPHNKRWKERQIARVREAIRAAEKIEDAIIRERTIKDLENQIAGIEDAFARNELDYGRKLYLIENCGVDIQPIAVQIAKMRFFISLTIEQKVERGGTDIPVCGSQPSQARMPVPPWNLGIRPLPNLETKFVAANTLIGIERPAQQTLRNPEIDALEAELRHVRERHFTARTQETKAKLRKRDAEIRAKLKQLLEKDGLPRDTTEKLAAWDPYDQNASADFFDPEWMFGIKVGQALLPVAGQEAQTGMSAPHCGFDIVIGNPPYGAEIPPREMEQIAPRILDAENSNSAALFIDVAKNILTHRTGVVSFVVPKSLLYSERWFSLVKVLAPNTSALVDLEQAFENVLLEQVVFVFRRSHRASSYRAYKFRETEFMERAVVPVSCIARFLTWPCDLSEDELRLGTKISGSGLFMRDVQVVSRIAIAAKASAQRQISCHRWKEYHPIWHQRIQRLRETV